MTQSEKVIKGLERCFVDNCSEGSRCPFYSEEYCLNTLMYDALKLLKEREARVLTWDEVEQAEVCWLEERGCEPYASLDANEWNPKVYGKHIRCWNYKPTKEQREAVKWE